MLSALGYVLVHRDHPGDREVAARVSVEEEVLPTACEKADWGDEGDGADVADVCFVGGWAVGGIS